MELNKQEVELMYGLLIEHVKQVAGGILLSDELKIRYDLLQKLKGEKDRRNQM